MLMNFMLNRANTLSIGRHLLCIIQFLVKKSPNFTLAYDTLECIKFLFTTKIKGINDVIGVSSRIIYNVWLNTMQTCFLNFSGGIKAESESLSL